MKDYSFLDASFKQDKLEELAVLFPGIQRKLCRALNFMNLESFLNNIKYSNVSHFEVYRAIACNLKDKDMLYSFCKICGDLKRDYTWKELNAILRLPIYDEYMDYLLL